MLYYDHLLINKDPLAAKPNRKRPISSASKTSAVDGGACGLTTRSEDDLVMIIICLKIISTVSRVSASRHSPPKPQAGGGVERSGSKHTTAMKA